VSFAALLRLLVSVWSTLVYAVSLPFLLCQTLYYDVFLGQILLYNVSFEDARIDRQILAVKGKTVLTLTSAGDNALDALTEGAAKVIAIDQNVAQSSLMELKLACIRQLPYDQFWQIFGQCNGAVFRSGTAVSTTWTASTTAVAAVCAAGCWCASSAR
jgi:S-adenosylmethionine:diacylglycerol 3-amino-3-carboxypropyl transferase